MEAVDQDGQVIDVFVQSRRDGVAAQRFFKRVIKSNRGKPRRVVIDKLRNYETMVSSIEKSCPM